MNLNEVCHDIYLLPLIGHVRVSSAYLDKDNQDGGIRTSHCSNGSNTAYFLRFTMVESVTGTVFSSLVYFKLFMQGVIADGRTVT